LYSFFSVKLRKIFVKNDNNRTTTNKSEVLDDAKLLLVKFPRIRGARTFKTKEIKIILEYVDAGYPYNFRALKKDAYFKQLNT
jgi:hypothetical protein